MGINCIVGQSGGPTSVINASLSGVITQALKSEGIDKIYGMLNGISGIFENNTVLLNEVFRDEAKLSLLETTPGAYLGSCRFKLPEYTVDESRYIKIFDFFRENDIKYFFYIGGNDSMDTVWKLSEYAKHKNIDVKIIGIPKTVDNDLNITDHTPGFGSAAKYIATTILNITKDRQVYNFKDLTIIEVMGRHVGWLTAAASLARLGNNINSPQLLYFPEIPFEFEKFAADVREVSQKYNNVIAVVSEGIKDSRCEYIAASDNQSKTDMFGHSCLGGASKAVESYAKAYLPEFKVRSIELSLPQRCTMNLVSKTDLTEAKNGRGICGQSGSVRQNRSGGDF